MSRDIIDEIQSKYGAVAASGLSGEHAGVRAVAEAFGYTAEELAAVPADANMGLSCGNPTAVASLQPGETVVDLGCGGGLDVFLAAARVGPGGRAIGIDMTVAMIDRARRNAVQQGVSNVEFLLSTIDYLPLPEASVDCVISNCVINLAPDKSAVFREIHRILKPGGRLAVSDIALKKALPAEVGQSMLAYIGCIAGAMLIGEYERSLRAANFSDVQVVDTGKDLNAYAKLDNQAGCCSPAMTPSSALLLAGGCCGSGSDGDQGNVKLSDIHRGLAELLAQHDLNAYAASVQVYAVKAR